jgi:lipopolysaccharide export system permease protein
MLSIYKKIIFKEWIRFFLGASFVLLLVLSLGHTINGIMRANSDISQVFIGLLIEIPNFLIKIFPVSCLVGSLFAINKLRNTNELTAIFASGYSRKEFMFDIFLIGTLAATILFGINSYVLPYAKTKKDLVQDMYGNFSSFKAQGLTANTINSGKIWYKSGDYFFNYSSFDKRTNQLHNVEIFFYDKEHKLSEKIEAKHATNNQKNEWTFINVKRLTNLNFASFPTETLYPEYKLTINESLDDFQKINSDITTLNIVKLWEYISILNSSGLNTAEYLVLFYDKFSTSFVCIVLSLLAATAIFNPNRRTSSFGKSVGFIFAFTLFYWFIYSYLITLGQSSKIPAFLATFGVPIIFTLVLFFYFFYHRKLR